jgi:hypothetical protein
MRLIDERAPDGSRHFACFPQVVDWAALCAHIRLLPGVEILNCVAEGLAHAWLDFRFRGQCFLVRLCNGLCRLTVRDPLCSDLILCQVGHYIEQLSRPSGRDGLRDLP